MAVKTMSDLRAVEHAGWSQGIQTLMSILIGAALAVAVSKAQSAKAIDLDYALRLVSFGIYCVGLYWFYHKFFIYFYRRASILSIMLPSAVGCALIATAHTVDDQYSFGVWTFTLIAGGGCSTATVAANCRRGKYKVVEALHAATMLRMYSATMIRTTCVFFVMACSTAAFIWGTIRPYEVSLDRALFISNGILFVIMSFLISYYFISPLEVMLDKSELKESA